MRVLFVANDPNLLVETSAVFARMQEYANAIGTLHIVTAGTPSRTIARGPLTIHAVSCTKFTRVRALASVAHRLIVSEDIQVVSAQDPFEHGLAALRAVQHTPAKLHIQIHTDFLSPEFVRATRFPMSLLNLLRQQMAGRVLCSASGIRVVSKRIKDSLVERYGTRIVEPTVIPIAVDTVLPEPHTLPEHSFSYPLVTVGRIESEKRVTDIVKALSILRTECPNVGLIVIGAGRALSGVQKLVKKLKLTNRVICTGNWSTAAWGMIRSSSAYIQASAYEGYGRTLVEAALAGVPVITTDVGIVGEVFTGKGDALIAPVRSPQSLAIHIRTLVNTPSVAEQVGSAGREAALKHLKETDSSASSIAKDLARLV